MTFIVDDQVEWFMPAAKDFVPGWYKIRKETQLPKPLPLL